MDFRRLRLGLNGNLRRGPGVPVERRHVRLLLMLGLATFHGPIILLQAAEAWTGRDGRMEAKRKWLCSNLQAGCNWWNGGLVWAAERKIHEFGTIKERI